MASHQDEVMPDRFCEAESPKPGTGVEECEGPCDSVKWQYGTWSEVSESGHEYIDNDDRDGLCSALKPVEEVFKRGQLLVSMPMAKWCRMTSALTWIWRFKDLVRFNLVLSG